MRFVLAVAAAMLSPVLAHAAGNADAGKEAFKQCGICHSVVKGENKIGPSLWGVVGRPAHSLANYTYSDAMMKHEGTWTPEALDAWIENPRKVVPGTKMIFLGIKDPQKRQDVIAYLETLK